MPSGSAQSNTVCDTLEGVTTGEPGPNSTWVLTGSSGLVGSSLVTTQRSAASKVLSPLLVPRTPVVSSEPTLVTQSTLAVMGLPPGFEKVTKVRNVALTCAA